MREKGLRGLCRSRDHLDHRGVGRQRGNEGTKSDVGQACRGTGQGATDGVGHTSDYAAWRFLAILTVVHTSAPMMALVMPATRNPHCHP